MTMQITQDWELEWGLRIPMRDGIHLHGTLYRPAQQQTPLPVILYITPYGIDLNHKHSIYFAQHGYVFLAVQTRGRGDSEGEYVPLGQVGKDAYDLVEWIARQSWCDGQVAMYGGSYAGYAQWAALRENPPHLRTIVPAAAVYPGLDFPARNNIFYGSLVQWISMISGTTTNAINLYSDLSFWAARFRKHFVAHRPFRELDTAVGNPSPIYQSWLDTPEVFAAWKHLTPTPEEYAHMTIPILSITGYYDGDQPGTIAYYREHLQYGPQQARKQHYLLIGPWDHGGTRQPSRTSAGLCLGENAALDIKQLHVEWYDWVMKGSDVPTFFEGQVAYYVAGADQWRSAESLEAIPVHRTKLYLHNSQGCATDVFHSGTLSPSRPQELSTVQYLYDPLDTRRAEQERDNWDEVCAVDQRLALTINGDGLIYHTAPYEQEIEISGSPRFFAWMSLDVPDTDFFVSLYEITRDGDSILLAYDLMRARYRESLSKVRLVEAGAIEQYVFDRFPFFSRRVARGSRIRLIITAPNSIYWQKNYNSGGAVADESGEVARKATITLYQGGEFPSYLEIPICKDS